MTNIKYNLSKSLITRYLDVESRKECPKKFLHEYILKDVPRKPPEGVMKLGLYFEDMTTLGKSEHIPDTKRNGDLSIDYERANLNAERCSNALTHHGFDITELQKRIVVTNEDGLTLSLVIDILAQDSNGRTAIIDTKYSGLIRDKWNPIGWNDLKFKDKLTIQAVHYKYACDLYGIKNADFYFVIYPPKNTEDARIIKCNVTDFFIDQHKQLLRGVKNSIDSRLQANMFFASPSLSKCMKCPLKEVCDSATVDIPEIEILTIDGYITEPFNKILY